MQSQDRPVELTKVFTQLTAPGATEALYVGGNSFHTFQYTLASVDTNVTCRMEGSCDNVNWFNLDDNRDDITENTNGTYKKHKPSFRCKYVRFNFVSETGGTAATLDVVYFGGKE